MEGCLNCHSSPCTCIQPKDLFGSPFYCQKRIRTRKFASPNSPLDKEELDDLQSCIEGANDLLRSLGNQRDEENTRQLQLHFLEMRGEIVSADIICECESGDAEESSNILQNDRIMFRNFCLNGKIANAGRDFLQINQNGSAVFILYKNLLSIKKDDCKEEFELDPEFIDAEKNLRRQLAFNFGEFVSKNPNFINLFFGIPLFFMLGQFCGKDIVIVTAQGQFKGTLSGVDEDSIELVNKKGKFHLEFDEVCYLKVFNLK
ncbi:hypothetical protein [Lysinibacillus sp. SGAir0095]|uniref:hypothetical protein n=1 Tax=Lysinibacillus sp. SGAir0095 TaxID=2070463 RepID=UPI0010CCBDBD|nr:hypothetical protein [Lysinibacillus sp. SGAir0095]QCR32293.1 hypothetical protein C1N55_08950 [Lysinibacillus sp. SGAir0095]